MEVLAGTTQGGKLGCVIGFQRAQVNSLSDHFGFHELFAGHIAQVGQ